MSNYSSLFRQAKEGQYNPNNPISKIASTDNQDSLPPKESITNSKIPYQTRNTPNFLSFNSNVPETKRSNNIVTIGSVLSYCLKSQSQITNALTDIGQYLKQLNEDSKNLSYSNQKHITTAATSNSISNRNSISNPKYKFPSDSFLQSILTKIDLIQSEIQFKLKEFEGWFQSAEFLNLNFSPDNHNEEHYVADTTNTNSFSQAQNSNSHSHFKNSKENPAIKNPIGKLIHNPSLEKYKNSFSKVNICDATSDVLDETPNMSKYYEIPSTDNSRMFQNDIPVSIGELVRPSNNLGKKSSSSKNKTNLLGSKQVKLLPKDNSTISRDPSTTNTNNAAAKSNKKDMVPAIKLDMLLDSKSHLKSNQAAPNKKAPHLDMEILRKNLHSYGFSTTIINRRDTQRDRDKIQTSRGLLSENHRETSQVDFMSAKSSPRDFHLEFGIQTSRPVLNNIPKKEIIDDSIDNPIDQTAQLEKSMLSTDEKPPSNILDRSPELENDHHIINPQNVSNNFEAVIAKKEKVIIKTLMKDQYGEEQSSYHKADYGKIHQKKYLINAKWWRGWKEYVNFDADNEGSLKPGTNSIYEIRHYPRPGAINNRELLRQDAITDLVNLTPELELKDNLLEHHDYEAVSKKVYDVLVKWYGSDFEICRVLRPDPFHENRPYLELYPKKKQFKRLTPKSMDTNNELNYARVINNIISSNLKHHPM